ncbi:MAG: lytic transglycosylase domain-containing protein [Ginsengibacter sp.]
MPFNILVTKAIAQDRQILRQEIDTIPKDTSIQNSKEDKTIEEVIHSQKSIDKKKVTYLNEVTKYGFKDLFKNYSYNPTMPYSSQVNPYAESYMQDYLRSHSRYLLNLKKTAVPYFNLIDGILSQYGLPRELKYLAVIESELKSTALSSAGALGPWQFMSYTAKDFGLRVNAMVDDRTDYQKSTHAASKYLLSLYKDLKDWLLVIAAYNGGPGRVYSAIKKSGSRNFWKLQYYLPEESRNHVKKFIATHYIMETDAKDIKFNYNNLSADSISTKPQLTETELESLSELPISGRYQSAIIAKNIGMVQEDFDRYNPNLNQAMAAGNTYKLRLPTDKMELFKTNKYPILEQCIQQLLQSADMNTNSNSKKAPPQKIKKKLK